MNGVFIDRQEPPAAARAAALWSGSVRTPYRDDGPSRAMTGMANWAKLAVLPVSLLAVLIRLALPFAPNRTPLT